ncbi:hypothetical protein ACA910_015413 [Epithemia clementina (nom. ined.)]
MKLFFHHRSLLLAAATLGYLSTTTQVTATTTSGIPGDAADFDLVDGTQYLRRHALEAQVPVFHEDNYYDDAAAHHDHDDFRALQTGTCPAVTAYDLPSFNLASCTTVQKKCSSGDLLVVRAYVNAGTCVGSTCTTNCQSITGTLRIVIDNKTGSTRTAFGIFGTLRITNAGCGGVTPCPLNRCADLTTTRGSISIVPGINDVAVGQISFPCRSRLEIVNYYLKWTDASSGSTCTSITCGNFKPKCGGPGVTITIEPPVAVTATATCNADKIDLTATVENAQGTLTYQWKDKNGSVVGGNTATLTNQLATLQPFTVTVSYNDVNNGNAPCSVTVTQTATQSCCSFSASCKTLDPITVNGCIASDKPAAKTTVSDIATVTNSCGTPTMTSSDSEPTGSVCGTAGLVITRTYTIKDSTNVPLTCSQTITIKDTSAPTFTLSPANINVECGSPCASTLAPGCTNGPATANDNCGTPTVTSSDVTTAGCGNTKTVTRTWTATDTCGNSATPYVQTITVVDTTNPDLTIPLDRSFECGDAGACTAAGPDCAGVATATDSCGAVELDLDDSTTVRNCETIINRAWIAKDACGRTATKIQKITSTDTKAPVISSCPNPITDLTCSSAIPPKATTVTATDACSTSAADITETYNCCLTGNKINRNWTFKDKCGNTASCSQDITIACVNPVAP